MTVPRKPKPQAADEAARVLRIYDMLDDELKQRNKSIPPFAASQDAALQAFVAAANGLLAVAERIAARTEG